MSEENESDKPEEKLKKYQKKYADLAIERPELKEQCEKAQKLFRVAYNLSKGWISHEELKNV